MDNFKKYSPEYYHNIAKKYIIKQSKYLEENEPKYYLDKNLAYNYIKVASIIKHTAGELAGRNFRFMYWQIKAIIDIFGTKHKAGEFKGLRRYQTVLFFMAKKGGKTQFGALLTILYFFLDDEKAKECYSIASDLDQAKIIHKAFTTMIKQEPELEEMVKTTIQPPRVSKYNGAFIDEYMAVSSTADSKDGLNVSMALVDEPHSYANKALYQIITDGMAGRNNPLQIIMSTAGYNMQGFFYRDIYQYAKKLQSGVLKDDSFYYILFEPDEEDLKDEDFWKKEEVWKKANPNYPISPTASYMKNKVKQAEQSEESRISFLTKHLNVWCDKVDIWIKHSVWTANQTPINEEDLKGRECYGALDLSSTTDLTCWLLLFPKENGYDILPRFFIPKDQMRERVRRDKVPYFDWVKKGLIQVTEGNVIDYNFIKEQIKKDCEYFNVKMAAYDRWNSSQLITDLTNDEVVELIPFGQGYASMSTPTKQIEVLALQQKLNHGDNEVMNWNCSNVVLRQDPSGNIKIDKEKSIEKVDGMVALAMALGIAILDTEEKEEPSVYNERGMRDL